ncbi:MAG: multicopper oxidase domain-containing protein [Gemmatimonadaceae bacterium]|nr:multicopper oxidase domain-containing protein [Gemmatimonadaceae bacterium]
MRLPLQVAVGLSISAGLWLGALTSGPAVATEAEAGANDNRQSAIAESATALTIDIVDATWRPEGNDGPSLAVWAFAVAGEAPTIPGPLLRRRLGAAPVRITLVNKVKDTIDVHGLSAADAPMVLAPGASRTATLTTQRAGNHLYWGARHGQPFDSREWEEGQLTGAVVIETPQERLRADRVMVVTESFRFDSVAGREEIASQLAVNGRWWPHTERLEYAANDSVHWRFMNGATISHPMHLHGFYFRVSRLGTLVSDTAIAAARQPLVVTEFIPPGNTMSLNFKPHEPGNWVFHCHFAMHVNAVSSMDSTYRDVERGKKYTADGRHMGGLVMGFHVRSSAPSPAVPVARSMHLVIDRKGTPFVHGGPGFSFALADSGVRDLPAAKRRVPGPVLLLKRGERVAITLHNRLPRPTSVHWHGLEIESFPDGVPHVSGRDGRLLHPVPARDSLTVEFTPPRSGTFMYHSHFSEHEQMNGGLYGAIIVVDDPSKFRPSHDHVLVVGGGGVPDVPLGIESPWGLVNGRINPPPIEMRVGETHRLRLASIHPDWKILATLGSETRAWTWRPVAKDGAALPLALQTPALATWAAGPGQTADFEVTPTTPGDYRLLVRGDGSGWAVSVPVTVSPRR